MTQPNHAYAPKPKPIYCDYRIDGPKVGARVVAWRKYCRHRVKAEGQRCWQHRAYLGAEC